MSLVTMAPLFADAERAGCGVGAFSVGSMEMVMGAIRAAEEMNTPIILQIAQVRLGHSPLHLMGPMMLSAAREAKVDVAVHLDHGTTMEVIRQALEMGFTSVMFDGSHLPLAENIAATSAVVEMARKTGASVEAELGVLGKDEAGNDCGRMAYTKPEDAAYFAEQAAISALAPAIGNAHGHYAVAPQLRFDILEQLHQKVEVPLVLHGGSGISDEDFQKCIHHGVRKVNIATSSFDAYTQKVQEKIQSGESVNYFTLNEKMVEGVYENVKRHIKIFTNRSENK